MIKNIIDLLNKKVFGIQKKKNIILVFWSGMKASEYKEYKNIRYE